MTKTFINDVFEASGFSTKVIASKIGVHFSAVTKWQAGTIKPNESHQAKIRQVFKKEISKLYK